VTTRAAAAGVTWVRRKIREAVDLAKLHGQGEVNKALAAAAHAEPFAESDLAAILAHHQQNGQVITFSEEQTLLFHAGVGWRTDKPHA
jgi:hypothetical protein